MFEARREEPMPQNTTAGDRADSPARMAAPSTTLPRQQADLQEIMQHLDGLVVEAIDGSELALAQVEVLWPTLALELEPQMAEESREQYLRYAMSIWNDSTGDLQTAKAAAALDVLCLLFDE